MVNSKYKRVILKLSGEVLGGKAGVGFDDSTIDTLAEEVREIVDMGVEIGVVVGGGNFFRGRSRTSSIKRPTGDYIGMLATVMNGLALSDAFVAAGIETRLHTSIDMVRIAEPYSIKKADAQLKSGKLVIFAGGTGCPFFSTDTTAVLRAAEMNAEAILFGKNIDAVYSDDPKKNKSAIKYETLTFQDILEKDLKVMDSTAASMSRDNNIKIHVFDLGVAGNIKRALLGEKIGTIIE